MRSLINAVLAYSQVGKQPVAFADLPSRDALNDALENLHAEITVQKAEISIGDLPIIHGDRVRLSQLFQNLVGNALKFTAKDRKPAIRIDAKEAGSDWVFSISDNGIGISLQHQDRIFRIFQRLHPPSLYPGSGIGLASCKKIVEQHGGQIWVESYPGVGSNFRFTIPKQVVIMIGPT